MTCELFVAACGIQFPSQGANPGPLHWELEILAAGPPRESLNYTLSNGNLALHEFHVSKSKKSTLGT